MAKIVKHGNKTHGEGKGSKLYNRWLGMRYRCSNKNHVAYKYYGAKGIYVCELWEKSYIEFKRWMMLNGFNGASSITIDRIDNKGPYSPENCRFIPLSENIKRSSSRGGHSPAIKISIDDASEICEAYATGLFSYSKIAKYFNVTKQAIYYIVKSSKGA